MRPFLELKASTRALVRWHLLNPEMLYELVVYGIGEYAPPLMLVD